MRTEITYTAGEDGEISTTYTDNVLTSKSAAADYLRDNDYCFRNVVRVKALGNMVNFS